MVVVLATNVTFPVPSTVQMVPFSHATIILKPNAPTLSNVSELWFEKGQPTCAKGAAEMDLTKNHTYKCTGLR